MTNKNIFTFITMYFNIYTAFFTPRIQSKGTEVQNTAGRQAGSRYHSCPSAQEKAKAKGEQEGRRVCIMSMADKFGHSNPSSMGRLTLDK